MANPNEYLKDVVCADYMTRKGRKTGYFCSWRCLRAWEKVNKRIIPYDYEY